MKLGLLVGLGALLLSAMSKKGHAYSGIPEEVDWDRFDSINPVDGIFVYEGREYPDYRLSVTMGLEPIHFPHSPTDPLWVFDSKISFDEAISEILEEKPWDTRQSMVLSRIKRIVPRKYRGLLAAIAHHESKFNTYAIGTTEDYGLYQITLGTADYGWNGEAGSIVKQDPYLLLCPDIATELAAVMAEVWDQKYGGGLIAGILRRWGGADQLLEPINDYHTTLARIAAYNDILA